MKRTKEFFTPASKAGEAWGGWTIYSPRNGVLGSPHIFVKVSHQGAWEFSVHLPTYRSKKFHLYLLNFPFLLATCPHHLLIMLSQALGWSFSAHSNVKVRHWLHPLVAGTTSLELGPRWKGLAPNLLFSWYKTEFSDGWFIQTWPLLE